MTTEAKIVYLNVERNKFNEEQTQLSIGFSIGEETKWMRYTIAGGTEGQQKFASMQLSKLLKHGGPYPVFIKHDERGKENVYFEDGFRRGGAGGGNDDAADPGW